MALEYRILSLVDIDADYWQNRFQPKLYEHSLAWLQASEQFVSSHLSQLHTLWLDGELIAALPLYTETSLFGAKKLINLNNFYSTEACLLTHEDHKDSAATLILYICQQHQWHSVYLGPLSQRFHTVIDELKSPKKIVAEQINWLDDDIESYTQYFSARPSKLKNTLKRKNKQLAKLEHQYRFVETSEDLDSMFDDYVTIYEKSWKGQEYSFDFIKAVCDDALANDKLCFAIVYINNQPVAAQIWFVENSCASIFKLAYDPDFKKLSIGTLLSEKITKSVIEQKKVNCIEFGMGNENYKKDWMSRFQIRQSILIFNTNTFLGLMCWIRFGVLAKLKAKFKVLIGNK